MKKSDLIHLIKEELYSILKEEGDKKISTSSNPTLSKIHEIVNFLKEKHLCSSNPWIDKTTNGYRVKLFVGTEDQIPVVQKALKSKGYDNVDVVMRGVLKNFVSVIVPFDLD